MNKNNDWVTGLANNVPRPASRYVYKPKPDITAFELAQVMPLYLDIKLGVSGALLKIEALPSRLKRHFDAVK